MAAKHKSSEAGNTDMPKRSLEVFPLNLKHRTDLKVVPLSKVYVLLITSAEAVMNLINFNFVKLV